MKRVQLGHWFKGLSGVMVAVVVAGCVGVSLGDDLVGKVGPQAAETGKGPFVFCYFLGNGDGLHLAVSEDGMKFTPVNGDKPLMTPTVGGKLMRDPCMRQGPDGVWHLVWTAGWYERGIGVASSNDLVHWSPQQYVEVMKDEPTAKNAWAPELFYDDLHKDWMIFWATTIPGRFPETEVKGGDVADGVILNHRLYYVTTKDFKTYSATKLFYDPGINCIDATIEKIGDKKYVMVLKDETKAPVAKKNLRMATAENPEGPWSKASEPFTRAWVEGPTVTKVGDAWQIYYDEYTDKKYGAVRTTDWKNFTVVPESELALPKGARHGTVVPITEAVDEMLKGLAEKN